MARQAKATKAAKQEPQPPSKGGTVLNMDRPSLKAIGGSNDPEWNTVIANQVAASAWIGNENEQDKRDKIQVAGISAMVSANPQDTIEGMLLAQLIASHNAGMECYRRAMNPQQTFEGRGHNLSQANKLSRTSAVLVEALSRYRSRGEQKITVQHVNIASGGQAIVGVVEAGGAGSNQIGRQCHAGLITTDALLPEVSRQDTARDALPVASNAKRSMQDARRHKSRRA